MQWPDWAKDVVLLVLGGTGSAAWFFWRRRVERTSIFENIQKAEKLLSLRKELDTSNYTIADLNKLEDVLMGRAEAAKQLSITFEEEACKLRDMDFNGATNQLDMNIAAGKAYERAEGKLQEVVEQMKPFYSCESWNQFEKAQRAWREYQTESALFFASRYEGGSIQPLIHASALEAVAIARIVELGAELTDLKNLRGPSD